MARLTDIMKVDLLRCASSQIAGPNMRGPKMPGEQPAAQPGGMGQNDQSDFDDNNSQQQNPELTNAPYVKLLTKLGYEYQGEDADVNGQPIGHSFNGPDGDMIMVKPDGSWNRFGPGAQNSTGKDVPSLGQNLVRDSLQQGDDQNHHSALRQAGYAKIHKDDQGNTYYKHPQTGKAVTVRKDGSWGSSVGTGRGAGKLRDFLGNEQMDQQDPAMQKMKMQQDQMKMQQKGMQQQQLGKPPGTRGSQGTRSMQPRKAGLGGRGGF